MAKNEHEEEVTGGLTSGLSYGASKKAKDQTGGSQKSGGRKEDKKDISQISVYPRRKTAERRSEKFNVLLKPSISRKMDEAVANGEIKSRNDLINVLLEQHFALDDAIKSGKFSDWDELVDYLVKMYT